MVFVLLIHSLFIVTFKIDFIVQGVYDKVAHFECE